jgi:hypothetical protein
VTSCDRRPSPRRAHRSPRRGDVEAARRRSDLGATPREVPSRVGQADVRGAPDSCQLDRPGPSSMDHLHELVDPEALHGIEILTRNCPATVQRSGRCGAPTSGRPVRLSALRMADTTDRGASSSGSRGTSGPGRLPGRGDSLGAAREHWCCCGAARSPTSSARGSGGWRSCPPSLLRSIYTKLGVSSRRLAVLAAQERGLFTSTVRSG